MAVSNPRLRTALPEGPGLYAWWGDAAAMGAAGHKFYVSANGVWLAAEVPLEVIRLPGSAWPRRAP